MYNLRNDLSHEDNHYIKGWELFNSKVFLTFETEEHNQEVFEQEAISHQRKHDSWLNVTVKFKEETQKYWERKTRD